MNRKLVIRLAFILLILLIITLVDYFGRDKYEVITKSQIEHIVATEGITVLAEERLNERNKPAALIFYEKEIYIGSYSVFNRNGKIEYAKTLTTHKRREKSVEVLGADGGYSYVMLRVNDKSIQEKMKRIVVTFGNKEVIKDTSPNQFSYIIVHDEDTHGMSLQTNITIYGEKDEILYNWD
ncbi:hypothetical protein WJ0W_001744 [Paenibacillus melissococcoides]|uniref:DUF5590 domain-containing protein n=1 Tax=Paenibacillus melissococcoides TaxID=2912268 RepID=A0ABM9FZ15_9BACL|nr:MULTISPECIES: hypothetical protein [Paenibacillus]MEB9892819.1 hypothetical protein [Bacillus cereus]CAH8244510.1 hypothetical protein WJ0W_001744 [Paenibacillus melissococcoides]CAH8708196.1 hypothetical protein WDD9_001831 [Paenibacillus melissococcoides]CAH8708903.1 hypothetical protein HTL2_002116 [Paenibacillus melissococcoides]GIO82765.1 hypothetical protein J6TS7_63750 [Paenibacillus dendritiformis]